MEEETVQTTTLSEELRAIREELVTAAPLSGHPVVQARVDGQLSLPQIQAIELQHYYEAKYFSTFVLNAVKKCDDDMEARKWMAENFADEASGEEDHASLILSLLDGLGVPREEAYRVEPMPGLVAWHEILEGITTRYSFLEAMAPFYLEDTYPPAARALHVAYRDVYHLPPSAIRTYVVHDEHDPIHGSRAQQIVERHLARQPEMLPRVKRAMKAAYNAYLFSFDGYWQAATGRREFWGGLRPLL
jgi:pyrroloquinoline quinone (PQQ) biosynthesis protein C